MEYERPTLRNIAAPHARGQYRGYCATGGTADACSVGTKHPGGLGCSGGAADKKGCLVGTAPGCAAGSGPDTTTNCTTGLTA